MERKKVRAVMLILASHNHPIYQNGRRVWRTYMRLDPQVAVYFVYGRLDEQLPGQDDRDLVYSDIPETYAPGMLQKTMRAIADLHALYDYDYFIRTNISTFWDWPALHRHLDGLPRQNCYSGDGPLSGKPHGTSDYLSGVDAIVTPEMIEAIIEATPTLRYDIAEDAALGDFFHGRFGAPMLKSRIHFMENFGDKPPLLHLPLRQRIRASIRKGQAAGADHFRVKTLKGDRIETDLAIYRELLDMVYGLRLDAPARVDVPIG